MRAAWEERAQALRSIGVLLMIACLGGHACGLPTSSDVAGRRESGKEEIPLLDSEPHGMGAGGLFDVTHDGSASYSVPLWVPQGRAGVQPSLALMYNSRAGDGFVGVGWNLAGSSAISRCPLVAATDGRHRGVLFDKDDGLCLDGRRLVHVEGAEHGHDGAIYRPRRNGHERVILHGTLDNPDDSWFEVEHPDGSRSIYGGGINKAANAYITGMRYDSDSLGAPNAGDPVIHSWLLERRQDISGNFVSFAYEEEVDTTADGRRGYDVRISEIRYTGHADSAGERHVRFHYGTSRAVPLEHYVAGLRLVTTKLLDRITMELDGLSIPLREYTLAYELSSRTGRPLLTAIAECDGNGVCLAPAQFHYSGEGETPSVEYDARVVGSTPAGWFRDTIEICYPFGDFMAWPQTFLLTDVDGSGTDDLLYFEMTEQTSCDNYQLAYRLRRSDWGALGAPTPAGIEPAPLATPFVLPQAPPLTSIDLDNDGSSEIIDLRADGNPFEVPTTRFLWEWDGTRLVRLDSDLFGCGVDGGVYGYGSLVYYGDVDASGSSDLIAACAPTSTDGVWMVRRHRSTHGSVHGAFDPPTMVQDADLWRGTGILIDYDGDRRHEFLSYRDSDPFLSASSVDPATGTTETSGTNIPVGTDYIYIDINGDGLVDVLDASGDFAAATIRVNTGRGLASPEPAYPLGTTTTIVVPLDVYSNVIPRRVRVADFNHDGLQDLAILHYDSSATLALNLSNGRQLVPQPLMAIPAEPFTQWFPFDRYETSWASVQMGDVTGDGEIDLVVADRANLTLLENRSGRPDLLTSIRVGQPGGLQADMIEIGYENAVSGRVVSVHPDSDDTRVLHEADSACSYPERCSRRGPTVVAWHSELTQSPENWAPGQRSSRLYYSYSYEGGRLNDATGSFLGFRRRTRVQWHWIPPLSENMRRYEREITRWDYDLHTLAPDGMPAYPGAPVSQEQIMVHPVNGLHRARRIDFARDAWTVSGFPTTVAFVQSRRTTTRDFELNEVPESLESGSGHYRSQTSTVEYDEYAIPYRWATWVDDGDHEETVATTDHAPALNRFTRYSAFDKRSTGGGESDEFHVDLRYEPATGVLEEIDLNATDPGRRVLLRRSPTDAAGVTDPTGVPHLIIERAWDPTAEPAGSVYAERRVELDYDSEGLHPTRMTAHVDGRTLATELVYHPGLSVLQRVEYPNLAHVEYQHDRFGRRRRETHSTGFWSSTSYAAATLATDQYLLQVRAHDGSMLDAWVDVFGRSRRTRVHGDQAGEWWVSRARWGLLGELIESEVPHVEGDPAHSTVYSYDDLLRPRKITHPNGGATGFTYLSPFEVETQSPGGTQWRTTYDAHYRMARLVEAGSHTTRYAYGAFGRLRSVDTPGPNDWTFTYDSNGFLATQTNTSTGTTTFARNGFGDLLRLTRPDATVAEFEYDALGRMSARVDPDGLTTWTYDCNPRTGALEVSAYGSLCETRSPDGTVERFEYGTGARSGLVRARELTTRHSASLGDGTMRLAYGHDVGGRVASVRMEGPRGGLDGGLMLNFQYGSFGHWDGVKGPGLPNPQLWEAMRYHPQGFVSQERFGSGVEAERDLDLTDRHVRFSSDVQHLEVQYDQNLNVASVNNGRAISTFEYDDRERLDRWLVNGAAVDYVYDESGNLLENESGSLTYDALGRIETGPGYPQLETDPRGRIYALADDAGDVRELSYTDFDLLRVVTSTGRGTGMKFRYTADQTRASAAASGTTTEGVTAYMAGLYERREVGKHVEETFRVPGPDRIVAEVIFRNGADPEVRFLHDDHLGSTAVVSDEAGEVVWESSFSPFGRRIEPSSSDFISAGEVGHRTRFTGHEVDGFDAALGSSARAGLIHMRGREYDPVLGRFLTPDPFAGVQSGPDAWNPFAYGGNNPTSRVDPTGFWPCDDGVSVSQCLGGAVSFIADLGRASDASIRAGEVWATIINSFAPGMFVPAVFHGQTALFGNPDLNAGFVRGIIPFGRDLNFPRAPSAFLHPGRARMFYEGEVLGASLGLSMDIVGLIAGLGMITGGGGVGILLLPETWGTSLAPAAPLVVAGLDVAGLSLVSGVGHVSNLVDALENVRGVQLNFSSNSRITFGRNSNQVHHAFRHTDDLGLHRDDVVRAVESHLRTVVDQIPSGRPLNQIVEVGGKRLQYSAYRLPDGSVNVGRIHEVP